MASRPAEMQGSTRAQHEKQFWTRKQSANRARGFITMEKR